MNDIKLYCSGKASYGYVRQSFSTLPSAGIWADRAESDEELLEEFGDGWRGFAKEEQDDQT